MTKEGWLAMIAGACLCVMSAEAQSPPTEDESDQIVRFEPDRPDYFEPREHGVIEITASGQLYELLEKSCPPNERTAKTGVPCAYISYAPPGTVKGAYENSLRPVLRVLSRERIWTYLEGQLALVRVSTLERVTDLKDANDPTRTEPYEPTGVVGHDDNEKRCKDGLPCVDTSFFSNLVKTKGILTPGCIKEIWRKTTTMRGPGEQSLCRFHSN